MTIYLMQKKRKERTHNEIEKVYNRTDRVSCHFPWSLCSITAIDEIGDMKLNDDSIDRFKKAAEYYQALDPNQNLEEKITNLKTYKEARLNYARLMIKQASLADKKQDGAADAVKEAREAVDTYVPADEKWNIENYQDLLDLEATYSSDGGSGSSDDAGEAPPMC